MFCRCVDDVRRVKTIFNFFSSYVETAHTKIPSGLTVRAHVHVLWAQQLGIVGKQKRESSFSDDIVFVKAFHNIARSLETRK